MADFQLSQLNVAHLAAPLDSPQLADFVANLDRINAIADASPGFVWRFESEEGDDSERREFGDGFVVNISVWDSVEALQNFVYRSAHVEILRRKAEWFNVIRDANVVLWWVPAGHRPEPKEARERLDLLRMNGPGNDAFTFAKRFPSPEQL